MEVDEIQCKFPRINNNGSGRLESTNLVNKAHKMDYTGGGDGSGAAVDLTGGMGRFYGWPSSRIVRVSRASAGKDRHSKVLTSKGLRDRRVRLSVNTAIQFYDLQDRLGFDQPSKAVEWLLKAAADSITELPQINPPFPDTPRQMSDEKRSSSDQVGFESLDMDNGGDPDPNSHPLHQQHVAKSSTCSSPSETSKGSGLSLSRSDGPIKARELGKECFIEKEMKNESLSLNPISHTTSFTELLSGGAINNVHNVNTTSPNFSSVQKNPNNGGCGESNFCQKSPPRQWSSAPLDYFSGFFGRPATNLQAPVSSPLFTLSENHHHQELQHFSFVPDHLVVPVVNAANGGNNNGSSEYNLNFTISSANSSGLAGFNRGTLQSNSPSSPSLLPHLQRYNNNNDSIDGSTPSFFISTVENHHQFLSPSWYSDAQRNNNCRHSTQKGREKN